MTMKAMTTVTLMATTMLLTVADSEMPIDQQAVTAMMPISAGRFTMPDDFSAGDQVGDHDPRRRC